MMNYEWWNTSSVSPHPKWHHSRVWGLMEMDELAENRLNVSQSTCKHGSIVKQSILFKAQSWIWFTAKYSESRQEQLVKLYTQSKLLLAYLWPLICYAMMENTSMFSPVTMTVRMLAWWRSCSTPGVSGFSLFCMMMRPRNSMFASMWSLIQRKTYECACV